MLAAGSLLATPRELFACGSEQREFGLRPSRKIPRLRPRALPAPCGDPSGFARNRRSALKRLHEAEVGEPLRQSFVLGWVGSIVEPAPIARVSRSGLSRTTDPAQRAGCRVPKRPPRSTPLVSRWRAEVEPTAKGSREATSTWPEAFTKLHLRVQGKERKERLAALDSLGLVSGVADGDRRRSCSARPR